MHNPALPLEGIRVPDLSRALMILAALFGCAMLTAGCGSGAPEQPPAGSATFPIHVESGKRHLTDATGRPFLVNGDSAWSLVVQLTREEAEQYLEDRRSKGFNAILVNLLEHQFATNPPNNVYGDGPFATPGDYGTPNEAYFAHVDFLVGKAAEKGLLVMMTPSYLGAGGGSEGWYQEMLLNADKLAAYGRYLGNRYQGFANILWVEGGDFNPPDANGENLVRAIADGIRSVDPAKLQTFHGSRGTAALEFWGTGEAWLTVDNIYTDAETVVSSAFAEYARATMPFFLVEAIYENAGASDQVVRTQAYQAVLSGATGHLMGNAPVWKFAAGWQQALESAGARSMKHLRDLFEQRSWWLLQPDTGNSFLTGGAQSGSARAVASRDSSGAFAVIYMPSSRAVTVDLAGLTGPLVSAAWYDPTNGQSTVAAGSPFAPGPRIFTSPGANAFGDGDWVLILESVP